MMNKDENISCKYCGETERLDENRYIIAKYRMFPAHLTGKTTCYFLPQTNQKDEKENDE